MTFQKLLDCADGGENCILCFPNNATACKFIDFVQTRRGLRGYESEVYRRPSSYLRYKLGRCHGTTVMGYGKHYCKFYTFYYYKATAKVV